LESFDKLVEIVKKLRSPDGCPWDREQTHKSLLPYLFEESNEVADTIIREDANHLKEELGDLLLQVLIHSEIENENNFFTIDNVIEALSQKLIRRHPHVFGEKTANNSDEVLTIWDEVKKDEKKDKQSEHILDKVPYTYSPLLRCYKLQKEAAKVGFDWEDYRGPLQKLDEEIGELKEAISSKDIDNIEHEIGDIFYALVNIGKFLGIRGDVALTKANNRFKRRFDIVEDMVKNDGKSFEDYGLEELDDFWNRAKKILLNRAC